MLTVKIYETEHLVFPFRLHIKDPFRDGVIVSPHESPKSLAEEVFKIVGQSENWLDLESPGGAGDVIVELDTRRHLRFEEGRDPEYLFPMRDCHREEFLREIRNLNRLRRLNKKGD